jgi:hypothetical protein
MGSNAAADVAPTLQYSTSLGEEAEAESMVSKDGPSTVE